MTKEEIESAAMKLDAQSRARLANRLLESLEAPSAEEQSELWAQEAVRRDAEFTTDPSVSRDAAEVLRDARARLA